MVDSPVQEMAKILPDRELSALIGKVILDGTPECVRVNSYEVRLGHKAHFDATREDVEIPTGCYLEIDPGDFVTVESLEKLDFSRNTLDSIGKKTGLFAWITPTTTMMREGFLFASTKVDVGYKGSLNWGIRNSSIKTVRLRQGERLFKLTIMELEASEVPDHAYGENPQDHYQNTNGIRESARTIQADIPDKLVVAKTRRKIDPIKELSQAGYPFNHIGTELIEIQGKFEIVSKDVAFLKTEFSTLQKNIEKKIDDETSSLSRTIDALPDKLDAKVRNAFGEQFGLHFDQRMLRVYLGTLTLGSLAIGAYKLIAATTPSSVQGWLFLSIGAVCGLGTLFLLRKPK